LQFEASLGRQFKRPYLEKSLHKTKQNETKQNKKRAGGVAPGVGPEFKLQYHEKKMALT
jgi:hypothetical protein